MFRIVAAPTFTFTVNLSRPDSDQPVPLEVTWRHKNTRQLAAWRANAAPGADDAEVLAEVIEGWANVLDENDQPVPYSREALAVLLSNFPAAAVELFDAYVRRLAEARAKN